MPHPPEDLTFDLKLKPRIALTVSTQLTAESVSPSAGHSGNCTHKVTHGIGVIDLWLF